MTKPHHCEKRTRRRLLGALTFAGGTLAAKGLPERWTRPAVEAVVLPAHAQMSPDQMSPDTNAGIQFTCSVQGSSSIAVGDTGTILMRISPAPGPGIPIQAMGTCNGTVLFDVTVTFDFSTGEATTTVTVPGVCSAGDTLVVELTAPSLGGASSSCTFDIT